MQYLQVFYSHNHKVSSQKQKQNYYLLHDLNINLKICTFSTWDLIYLSILYNIIYVLWLEDKYTHNIIDCRGIKIFTHSHPFLSATGTARRSETECIIQWIIYLIFGSKYVLCNIYYIINISKQTLVVHAYLHEMSNSPQFIFRYNLITRFIKNIILPIYMY